MAENRNVIIIGGGVIGLGIGWQLAKAGASVTLYERARAGRAASWAAAGMLAPLAEAHTEEPELLKLGCHSLALYPHWVKELEADADMSIGYREEGTLIVGLEPDDTHQLRHLYTSQQQLGLDVEWLPGRDAREIEPALSPRVTAAIRCTEDRQVDNRRMVTALRRAYQARGGVLHENSCVEHIEVKNGAATGVSVGEPSHSRLHEADVIVLAAGPWSSQIEGIPEAMRPPVRPVKGQMLALQMETGITVETVIRTVRARYPMSVYLVPRTNGRLIIGATSEEMGFDTRLTAGGLFELLRGAWEAVPGVYELPILETWSGLRPGSRDNAPILGHTPIDNLIVATGHYRNGILLTPVTAYEISKLILTGEMSPTIAPFQLKRFFSS